MTILTERQSNNVFPFDPGYLVAGALSAGAVGLASGYTDGSGAGIVIVRATAYTQPAAAGQLEVVSNSANDDGPSGTGGRTLRIVYYDGNCLGPFTEDITLNGTAAVATVATNMRFIECMHLLTVGSTGTNAGTITLRAVGGGAVVGTIAVSDGRTFWCHHFVAAGRVSKIFELTAGMTHAKGTVFLRAFNPLVSDAFERQITGSMRLGPQGAGAAAAPSPLQPSLVFPFGALYVPGPARVAAHVDPDGAVASNVAQVQFGFLDV